MLSIDYLGIGEYADLVIGYSLNYYDLFKYTRGVPKSVKQLITQLRLNLHRRIRFVICNMLMKSFFIFNPTIFYFSL